MCDLSHRFQYLLQYYLILFSGCSFNKISKYLFFIYYVPAVTICQGNFSLKTKQNLNIWPYQTVLDKKIVPVSNFTVTNHFFSLAKMGVLNLVKHCNCNDFINPVSASQINCKLCRADTYFSVYFFILVLILTIFLGL